MLREFTKSLQLPLDGRAYHSYAVCDKQMKIKPQCGNGISSGPLTLLGTGEVLLAGGSMIHSGWSPPTATPNSTHLRCRKELQKGNRPYEETRSLRDAFCLMRLERRHQQAIGVFLGNHPDSNPHFGRSGANAKFSRAGPDARRYVWHLRQRHLRRRFNDHGLRVGLRCWAK